MDLRQLTHFVALAETGRFVLAAEHVHLSQAAFSRSIQTLEARVGLRLFDRGPKGAQLTPAGKVVLDRARQLLFDQRCFKRDVELLREGQIGELGFGAGPVPAATVVPPLLIALRQSQPGVMTRVRGGSAESLLQLLHDEQIDFFMADSRMLAPDERLQTRMLGTLYGGLYCRSGHPLVRQREIPVEAILTHGVATHASTPPLREMLRNGLGLKASQLLPVQIECDDMSTLARLARDTNVLVPLPLSVAAEAKGLKRLRIRGKPPALNIVLHAIWLRGRTLPPAADLALDVAAELISALPQDD